MFKIYLRLLTFVRPIGKYAVPYFIYSILHALFNTVNYIMLIPIIQAMFDPEFRFEPLYVRPEFAFDEASLSAWLRYAYTSVFGEYNPMYVLILLATVTVLMNLLSNTFRYLGGMDGREHAHAHAAKDAQRTVRQRHQPQRRIFSASSARATSCRASRRT